MPRRRNRPDTFGGVEKIDAEPETIAQSIFARTKKQVNVPVLKDGKPVIDTGDKETERQVLMEQEEQKKVLEREKAKQHKPGRRML